MYYNPQSQVKLLKSSLQAEKYQVYKNATWIAEIETYQNKYHAQNTYLKISSPNHLDLAEPELFFALKNHLQTPLQYMLSSDDEPLIQLLKACRFKKIRSCFEYTVSSNDWQSKISKRTNLMSLKEINNPTLEHKAIALLYQKYQADHFAINPITASKAEFATAVPKQIYTNSVELSHLAFVEDNEIAYLCTQSKLDFPIFISSLLKNLFTKFPELTFEADDTDWEASYLAQQFCFRPEISWDTYILS